MSASLLSRTSRQPLMREGIVLPFLYRTKTILRAYADKSEDTAAYVPTHPKLEQERSTDASSPQRRRQNAEERPGRLRESRSPRPRASGRTRTNADTSARSRDDGDAPGRRQAPTRDRERLPDVPFEGHIPSNDPNVRVQGTTITPKELAIFETLFRSKQVKPADSKKAGAQQQKAANMAKVVPNFPAPLRALADEARVLHANATSEDQDAGDISSRSLRTSEAAEKFFARIKARMDKASTDVALWQIMTDEVFNNIKALKLDDPCARASMKPEDVEGLTRSLPSILLHFMSLMQSKLPGSSYGLVLLPTLKKLGPSAFALGATTDLYNEHMQIIYKQYSDLDSIASTMAEMDKEVYEFNSGTSKLLQSIFQRERAATSGRMGPGMQALWTTDRKTRALEKLRRWDKTVQEQLRAAAVRKAREKEFQSEADAEDERELEAYGGSHTYVATA
ncbi:hypothetical protein CLAFUW4_09085 [Fulvia fulva]|nr:hypothetical protein CLAFUR4_09091 [Fulvia fulva]KAK4614880.1 hypothetical protein CLAFUR0_09083 [Fulvia fulva]WPV20260.1 hypothetical protein CLAFUW4_09085 [Fulvia fulva]WPV35369.1 hypothetical protein CLAFUW7_09086 [Fulvia fulva]